MSCNSFLSFISLWVFAKGKDEWILELIKLNRVVEKSNSVR